MSVDAIGSPGIDRMTLTSIDGCAATTAGAAVNSGNTRRPSFENLMPSTAASCTPPQVGVNQPTRGFADRMCSTAVRIGPTTKIDESTERVLLEQAVQMHARDS